MTISEVFRNVMTITGSATRDGKMVIVGQPLRGETVEWFKFVKSVLQSNKSVEVAKMVVYDEESMTVGFFWRLSMPEGLVDLIDEPFSGEMAGDPVEIVTPSPKEQQPQDKRLIGFGVISENQLDGYTVAQGMPNEPAEWKSMATSLLVDHGALEIAKIYESLSDGRLAGHWRVVLPPLEPPPEKEKPVVKQPVKSPTVSRLDDEKQKALRRWMARNRTAPPKHTPEELEAIQKNVQEYRERLKKSLKMKNGKVVSMPVFDPYDEATARLQIVEGVKSDGTIPGFKPPGPGMDI